jgi:hypothetical protein
MVTVTPSPKSFVRWLLACASRYTRNVSWRYRISVVLLLLLSALPVSGMVCTMLCGSAATAHHASEKLCDDEQAAAPSPGPQMRAGTAGHGCNDHDAAMREAATTPAARADSVPAPNLLVSVPVHDSIRSLADSDAVFEYRTPRGNSPPAASPLVLRV